jgi:hypothetical protein
MNTNRHRREGVKIMATKTKKRAQTPTTETTSKATATVVEGIRPNDLAKGLGIDGKRVRAFLRSKFPRTQEEHNTNWALTKEQVKAARDHFAKKADDATDTSDESDES